MRKNFITLVVLSVCIIASSAIYAQDKNAEKALKAQKTATKTFITATTKVISQAIAAKKKSKRAEGEGDQNIAKAYDHQKHAIELYAAGTFDKAIYHSLKARKYAALSIASDKGKYDDATVPEVAFKDFKNPDDKDKDKKKEAKAYYKNMKEIFKYKEKDGASLGDLESELDADIEKTEDDAKVTPALMKELVVPAK